MNRPMWRLLAAAVLAAALASPAMAQKEAELGFQITSLLRDTPFYGIGFSTAYRTGGRARIAFGGLYGVADETATARAELAGHFMVSPGRRGGVGLYGLGGVAAEAGLRHQAYLILGLGLETNPAGGSGFHFEAGIGGGFRLSAGWRARWPDAGRKP
jgi:opacity protein-like surface antigen